MVGRYTYRWSIDLRHEFSDVDVNSESIFVLLFDILRRLSARRRAQLVLLVFVMLLSSLSEVVTLAAVMPLLAVLSNPDLLRQMPLIQSTALNFGIVEPISLLVLTASLFSLAVLLSVVVRLSNLWMNGRLAALIGSDLSCEAYTRMLYQSYATHLALNSSEVINAATTQIQQAIKGIEAGMQFLTASLVSLGLLCTLLAINWQVACLAISVFGGCYGLLFAVSSRRLNSNSRRFSETSQLQLKALQEGLGAIRDVLMDGTQEFYRGIYRKSDLPMRLIQAQRNFIDTFPRYLLEALGLMLIAGFTLLISLQQGSTTKFLPLLGIFALGAQKLLPALQQVYAGLVNLSYSRYALIGVLGFLDQPLPIFFSDSMSPLAFCDHIHFDNICFQYASESSKVLSEINLVIKPGQRVGIIGTTGSGKSTLADIMMGLLEPSAGQIRIDNQDLYDSQNPERVFRWRASIAHVPQFIYLADSSIAENIAFGIPLNQINFLAVKLAAQQAQIASFIESTANGYSTWVGERGIRLSGGQRQRIGIARALYKHASVLVFDEATSALDDATEKSVMRSVESLSRELTLIIIAHRLTSLRCCDRVIELKDGYLKREMTGMQAANLEL